MSPPKKTKEKVKFAKLRLRSSTSKSKFLNSPRRNEKISSYFSSVLNETESNSQLEKPSQNTESQKSKYLSGTTPSDNEDDFQKTKTQKPTKMFEVKKQKEVKNTKKSARDRKAVPIFGTNITVEPECSDTNQEHLQLAIAMSKSLDELENPKRLNPESNNTFPSTQEKIEKIKSTLDQFGFRSNKSASDLPAITGRAQNSRKRFKHITPTLFLRTDEDRAKIIENKVAEIIENIAIYNENMTRSRLEGEIESEFNSNKPSSFVLRDYYVENAVLFKKNRLVTLEMSQKVFYNNTVAPSSVKVGALLKDWRSIPGREKSPPLSDAKKNTNSIIAGKNKSPKLSSESLNLENNNINNFNTNSLKGTATKPNRTQASSLKNEHPYICINSRRPSPQFIGKFSTDNSNNVNQVEPKISNRPETTPTTSKYIENNQSSEFSENRNMVHHLYVNTSITRSISPDLFSDNDSDADLFNKNNKSMQFDKKMNIRNSCEDIFDNYTDSSCATILLSPQKITKTESSPQFAENKNLVISIQETSSDGDFSIDTKILSPQKNSKIKFRKMFTNELSNSSSDTKLLSPDKVNKNANKLSPFQAISSASSSRDTVLWNGNQNSLSPFRANSSTTSTDFSHDTKLLSYQSDSNSVSLLEISPQKIKVKTSLKRSSSCKKNLLSQIESVSLLDISPRKDKSKSYKVRKSLNTSTRSLLNDIKPINSDINLDKNDTFSETRKNITSSENNNNRHFESFCDDSNNCFDLTQSSDDGTNLFYNKTISKPILENQELNNIRGEAKTPDNLNVTHQNTIKQSENNLNSYQNCDKGFMNVNQNEKDITIDLTMSPKDSKAMNNKIQTNKLVEKNLFQNEKKPDEADDQNEYLDTRNNKELHDPIDKTFISSSDIEETHSAKIKSLNENEFIFPPTSPNEFCYNKLYDEDINIVSFLGHVNRNEIPRHKSFEYNNSNSAKMSDGKNFDNNEKNYFNSSKTSKKNHLVLDQSMNADKLRNKTLRRSFSDNVLCNNESVYRRSEKSFPSRSFRSKNKAIRSISTIEDKNELLTRNIISEEANNLHESIEDVDNSDEVLFFSKDNMTNLSQNIENLSQSNDSIDISDEELNYSCNKIKNIKAKSASKLLNNSSEEQKEESSDDDVQFLSQSSITELENIKRWYPSKLLIASSAKEKEEEIVDDIQFVSQSSIVACSEISDEKLNYSNNILQQRKKIKQHVNDTIDNYILEELNDIESFNIETNILDFNDLPCTPYQHSESLFGSCTKKFNSPTPTRIIPSINDIRTSEVFKYPRVADLSTPTTSKVRKSFSELDDSFDNNSRQNVVVAMAGDINKHGNAITRTPENVKPGDDQIITPNSDVIVKTSNVTPMPNYNDMNTPRRNQELEKFGLKPMKRSKGVKILRYIYDATHPVTANNSSSSEDENERVVKRRKKNCMKINIDAGFSDNNKGIKRKGRNDVNIENNINKKIEIAGNKIAESESLNDMIFERTFSSRIASCRLPLHIVWHNFVSSQPDLHEKILLYVPLQIEDIYMKLKSFGFKFHIQDLIAFLDKKCITIRVAQTNRRKKIHKSPKGK